MFVISIFCQILIYLAMKYYGSLSHQDRSFLPNFVYFNYVSIQSANRNGMMLIYYFLGKLIFILIFLNGTRNENDRKMIMYKFY